MISSSQSESQLQSQIPLNCEDKTHTTDCDELSSINKDNTSNDINNITNDNNGEEHCSQKRLHNPSNNNDENCPEFQEVRRNVYQVIRAAGCRMLISQLENEYEQNFKRRLKFHENPKYFIKMEKLLLLNCDKTHSDDVMAFYTHEPAYKLVFSILKQHSNYTSITNTANIVNNINKDANNDNNNLNNTNNSSNEHHDDKHINNNITTSLLNEGISVSKFRSYFEERIGMSLDGCDFVDFLTRWRFLSIRKNENGEQVVLFTPHTGTTVFFGNLNIECTENDIYSDLSKVDPSWKYSSIRLKLGKGFAYAFVDFPSFDDALRAVKYFDGRAVFKSKYVCADIEAIEQKKLKMKNNNHCSIFSSPSFDSISNINKNSIPNDQAQQGTKTTIYLGNLRDNITKQQISDELSKINSTWKDLTVRLNLRSGWSHAFIDFDNITDAKQLLSLWHNDKTNSVLTTSRLRCEASKRQMI